MDKADKLLKKLDIFSNQVVLNFKNKQKYQSKTGGVLSVFVVLVFVLYCWSKFELVNSPRGNAYQFVEKAMSDEMWKNLGNVTLNQTGVMFYMKLKNKDETIKYDESLMRYITVY